MQIYPERVSRPLKEDYISLLLQVENEYHNAIIKAVREAEAYAGECRQRQDAYLDGLRREWYLFGKTENEKLLETLSRQEHKLELETAGIKRQMKENQIKKADLISERLKEEVLNLYGDR
jgi:hypothetical protein